VQTDWLLALVTVLLVIAGLLSICSEGINKDGLLNFRKQLLNTAIGLIPMAALYFVPLRILFKASNFLYGGMVALLAATLVIGKDINGSQRWIDLGPIQFQPSDPAKLLAVISLAAFFARRQDRILEPSTFWLGLAHIAIPILLLLKQPHLASAVLFLVIGFAVSLVAGTPMKFFGIAIGSTVLVATLVIAVPTIRQRVLMPYQLERVKGLMSASKDEKGNNWQTDQAEIAFGVGGIYGTGFLNGKQKELKFIPEQRNDFVFTVVGEEGGLIGCTVLLFLYGVFFWRAFLIMHWASEPFHQMLAAGVYAVLGFHTIVNLGMVLQLLPVAGMWLPFMSSGGTAIWLCLACVGLLLNIKRQETAKIF
jgi:rod shape determining protein RodA